MTVELICVGTELLLGNIVNTNAAYMSGKLAYLGLTCYHQSVVGDNEKRLEDAVSLARSRSDIVILSGGLGPTKDDITKEVTARVYGRQLIEDKHTREWIQSYCDRSHPGRLITENTWKQTLVPEGAIVFDNHNGTAPGLVIKDEEGKMAILLPGPPNELIPMFEKDVAPFLGDVEPEGIYSKMVKLCGIGESVAETIVSDLMDEQSNPTLAPYAKVGEVHFRVTAKAIDEQMADQLMDPLMRELYKRFGTKIYTTEEKVTLADAVVELLRDKEYKIAVTEGFTAGLFAGRLMNVPGASLILSDCRSLGFSDSTVKCLKLSENLIEEHTLVSKEATEEIAKHTAEISGVQVAVAITGVAGIDDYGSGKQDGLINISIYVNGKTTTKEYHLTGNREKNRDVTVTYALTILREELL